MKKHENEVIELYSSGSSMKDIANKIKIPARLIRRILVENNQVEFDKNGHITRKHSEDTKRKIASTLEKYNLDNGFTKYDYELLHSEETKKDIKNMYNQGYSLRSIGQKYNVRGPRIAKILKDLDE